MVLRSSITDTESMEKFCPNVFGMTSRKSRHQFIRLRWGKRVITTDNGTGITSRALDEWAHLFPFWFRREEGTFSRASQKWILRLRLLEPEENVRGRHRKR